MADKQESKPPDGKAKPPKKPGSRPDIASLAGLALALGGILGGLILEKGQFQDVAQATAAMIVFGGTIGAVMITTPMPIVLRAFGGLRAVFFEPAGGGGEILQLLIAYAAKARKNGIVSLETEAATAPDPFLRKALNLAVDGTDLQELRKMMEIDMALIEHGSEGEAKVWEAAGGYAPTIGIIGAVMGLIQVMKHLDDIKEVGHGIAVAFVATLYGVGVANLFFLPAASKLRARAQQAMHVNEMILEGISGIVEGLNPTLIRLKLESFHPPAPAKSGKKGVKDAAKGPAGKGAADPEPA
jgi:chemotaxis protein MotA